MEKERDMGGREKVRAGKGYVGGGTGQRHRRTDREADKQNRRAAGQADDNVGQPDSGRTDRRTQMQNNRQQDRQSDRTPDSDTDRKPEIHTNREPDSHTNRRIDREDRQTDLQIDR